jgi:hypothetical protein
MIEKVKNELDITEAIAELEQKKMLQKQQLTNNFHKKIQSMQPANLMKAAAVNVMAKPSLKKGLLLTAAGVGGLFILKKIFSKRSGGRGLLFMAISGAGTMLVKKVLATGIKKVIKI